MTLRQAGLVLAATAALGACSTSTTWFEPKKAEYKTAGSLPPLEIPPDLSAPSRDGRFNVPETGKSSATLSGYQAERGQQAKAPGSTAVLPTVDKVRIERSGNQRWLVVKEAPEKLWAPVKDFWQDNGFLIKVEQPAAGVMETDWAENRAKLPQDAIRATLGKLLDQIYSTSELDKFRTRLERTADGGTEIYISHRGMEEVYSGQGRGVGTTGQTMWQPRAPDPGLEAEFLGRLMVRLGEKEESARQQIAAAGGASEKRAAIGKTPEGAEILQVYEPFDRAWRRVGLALDRVGFTVEDRDRQKGVYFVRYADPEAEIDKKKDEQSWLSKLAFWRSEDPKVKAAQYRVQVKPQSETSEVSVLNKDGGAESSQTSHRILTLLHDQLK